MIQTKSMFKYLRKLPGKWFLAIIMVLWVVGAAVTWRFYSRTTCLILTFVIIAVWLIYILVTWLIKRRRGPEVEEAAALVPGFEERLQDAMRAIKHSSWYLVIGPPGSGKTNLFMNSDLDFPFIDSEQKESIKEVIRGTERCNLFRTKEQIIFDTAGRYVHLGNEKDVKKEWLALLQIMRKHRKMRPIEGLIIAVDIDRILQNEEDVIKREANFIRNRIIDIITTLGMTFPVYLVFTKCDLIYGFTSFFRQLSPDKRMQIWGSTLRTDQQGDSEVIFRQECEELYKTLMAQRASKLASAGEGDRGAVYMFPLEFRDAYQKLANFVEAMFLRMPVEKPIFRGFYFTGVTHGGKPPIDFAMKRVARDFKLGAPTLSEPEPEEREKGRGYFITDLFNRVIFPDKGLNRPTESTSRRRMYVILGVCAALLLLLGIFSTVLAVSYTQNKKLMAETEEKAKAIGKMRDQERISPDEPISEDTKKQRYEDLRKPIIRLEKASLISLAWRKQRNEVAEEARKIYLLERYGEGDSYKTKLTRRVEIPVKVVQSDLDESNPIEKVEINAKFEYGSKEYKLKPQDTNKNGEAVFKTKVEDGRVKFIFSIDHKIEGYEVENEQNVYIEPGEQVIKDPRVLFTFSKLGRLITVTCKDQDNMPLAGVKVTAIEQPGESGAEGKELAQYEGETNHEGIAQLKFQAQVGTAFRIYYDESPNSFKADDYDEVVIGSGKSSYSMERQLRRKIQITIKASPMPERKVTVTLAGKRFEMIENQMEYSSDTIPDENDVTANPKPKTVTVTKNPSETSLSYTILLEYEEDTDDDGGGGVPPVVDAYLKAFTDSGSGIDGADVWIYVRDTRSASEDDRIETGSGIKLMRLGSTDRNGSVKIPRDANVSKILISHLDYWPEQIDWDNTGKEIKMTGIDRRYRLQHLDKVHIDGAVELYGEARSAHQRWNVPPNDRKAIELYRKAILLNPTKKYYYRLAWIYSDIGRTGEAREVLRKGVTLNIPESEEEADLRSGLETELGNRRQGGGR